MPANNTASVFSLDGKQVVAFYAAGSALAGSPHGDDLWLLGLHGKLGPAKLGLVHRRQSACRRTEIAADQSPCNTSTVNVAYRVQFTFSTQTVSMGTVTFKVKNTAASPTI